MYKVEWDNSLSVGVEAIDNDHKDLIELINKLFEAINTQYSNEILEEAFASLNHYVKDHFTHEEALMKKYQYPNLEEHILLHQGFVNELPKMKEKLFSAGSYKTALNVYQFLADWLINHIIKEDLKYTQYIHNDIQRENSKIQKFIQKTTKNFTIRMRLWALATIPIFIILVLVFITVKENYNEYLINKNVYQSSLSFMEMNRLTNALQLERGLSVAYTLKQNEPFKKELLSQRNKVDLYYKKYIENIKEFYPDIVYRKKLNTFNTQYQSIKKYRNTINKNKSNIDTILNTYSQLIQELLTQAKTLSLNIPDQTLRSSLITLSTLLYQKEQMGLKRAVGTEILEMKDQSKFKKKFLELNTKELVFRNIFLEQTTDKQKNAFLNLEDKARFKIVKSYENIIISQIIDKKQASIDSKLWFKNMTKSIEYFKIFIDKEVDSIQKISSNKVTEFTTVPLIWTVILTLLSFLLSYLVILLERTIYHPIKKFSNVLTGLSKGERTIHFLKEDNKKDEFGLLQDAYEALRIELLKSDRQEIKIIARDQKTADLENIAFIDPLTGALNRRKLDEIFNYEFTRSKRYERDLSILLIDVDHFKNINDTYGHDTGDIVLQKLVSLCKQSMRSLDYLFRFGGEEFIILLPETDLNEAQKYAKRLCNFIADEAIILDKNTVQITVSIGISAYRYNIDTKTDNILKRADKALYIAKKEGRNRVFTEG